MRAGAEAQPEGKPQYQSLLKTGTGESSSTAGTDQDSDYSDRPRRGGGSGAPIGELLRPISLPMKVVEAVVESVGPCLGRALLRVHTPTSVFACRDDVRAVEGDAFVRNEAVHIAVAFELLCEQVARAPLNVAGRIYVQQLLEKAASTRRRVYRHIARNPSIATVPVRAPVFIIGLPRTGSTHLQTLLSADNLTETLKFWEMLKPLPLTPPGSARAALRCRSLAFQKSLMDVLSPGWNAANTRFHKVEMDGPEEEAVLLAGCGLSMMPYVCLGGEATAYEAAHADPAGKRAIFRYLRRFLQMASETRPAGGDSRWVLKSHYNALWTAALLEEFPDAKVIITVRSPLEVVQSFLSFAITNLSFVAKDGEGEQVSGERRGHRACGDHRACGEGLELVGWLRVWGIGAHGTGPVGQPLGASCAAQNGCACALGTHTRRVRAGTWHGRARKAAKFQAPA
jgi:hypothetical protein